MIFNWKFFNESNQAIYFSESDIYKDLIKNTKIPNSIFDDFLIDLKDDFDMEYVISQIVAAGKITENSVPILILLKISKKYPNSSFDKRTNQHNMDLKKFESFLKSQINDINNINNIVERMCKSENIEILSQSIDNSKSYTELNIHIKMEKLIMTDEFHKAQLEFNKNLPNNEIIKKKNLIIDKLIKMGVKEDECSKLIDVHPDYENMDYVIYGFLTDDEIIDIAHYNKESGEVSYTNIIKAVRYYNLGYCNGILNEYK